MEEERDKSMSRRRTNDGGKFLWAATAGGEANSSCRKGEGGAALEFEEEGKAIELSPKSIMNSSLSCHFYNLHLHIGGGRNNVSKSSFSLCCGNTKG